jgi:threonylcarbamoyladenosine tRNA methylthiotransferase MtaB
MGRHCSSGQFLDLVQRARAGILDLAVTTDIIVGFPGEDEEEFSRTWSLAEGIGFARIHVFPFSARPGTVAAEMPNQVSPPVAQTRVARLLELGKESSRAFRARFLGRTSKVLWENQHDGVWNGLTGNYIRVETRSGCDLHNRITTVQLTEMTDHGLLGELPASPSQIL